MQFKDYQASLRMRDVITRIVKNVLDTERPRYRYATVTAIDRPNRKCTVQFQGEVDTVTVVMGSIQPNAVGQMVRVGGIGADRFVEDVIGTAYFDDTELTNELTTALLLSTHPVGSIYISVDSTDPGTLFGGTWVAWGSGRVPVGVDAGQVEFDTVEEVGGAKTVALTAAQMPIHNHPQPNGGDWQIALIRDIAGRSGKLGATSGSNRMVFASTTSFGDLDMVAATGNAGSGQAHNNLQPYITCYMWKRTA